MSNPCVFAAALVALAACGLPDDHFIQQTYLKASNPDGQDVFGRALALAADGGILAVGAPRESGSRTGIDPPGDDNAAHHAGAVYAFARDGATWGEPVYIKASNATLDDEFGTSVALSSDGKTLAVGAPSESSPSLGIGVCQGDTDPPNLSGAAYVFLRVDGTWVPQACFKPPSRADLSWFGTSVALSSNGSILAVGAPGARCTSGASAGAVFLHVREDPTWRIAQCLPTPAAVASGTFGSTIALSYDGAILAVGDVNARAAYVFVRSGETWTLQPPLAGADPGEGSEFGDVVAMSEDGAILAVGAPRELDGGPTAGATPKGAVYVFARGETTWSLQDHVTAASVDAGDSFGRSVALSANGKTLAVGTPAEDNDAAKQVPLPSDLCTGELGGTVHVFTSDGTTWRRSARVKGTNTCMNDHFGADVGLSRDGAVLAVGADGEASGASGVDGDQGDSPGAENAGAAYVMEL